MPIEIYMKLLELAERWLGPVIARLFMDTVDAEFTITYTPEQTATLQANRRKLLDMRADAVARSGNGDTPA